jgi:hypothetical protein
MGKRYWHYTVYQHLKKIAESGEIRPTAKYTEYGEIAVVWFSTNPVWEETVRKSIKDTETSKQIGPLSRDGLSERGLHPVRIEVNPTLVDIRSWNNFKKRSGISKPGIKSLIKSAKHWGADPKEWWVSYEAVPSRSWLSIEIWVGRKWVDMETFLSAHSNASQGNDRG